MNNAQLINQSSGEVEFYTPQRITLAACDTMDGIIHLDPASSEVANRTVGALSYFTKEVDGLAQEWHGNVWMNHPFGRGVNEKWINKLVGEYGKGNTAQACCICFASTSEAWFRPLLKRPQCFLVPRTNYLLPDGTVYRGVTKGSVVTYFGPNVDRFAECFKGLGEIKLPWAGRA
jgi:hypothetical protein